MPPPPEGALQSRMFSPFAKGYCWEDYEEEMRRDYPIRFFLTDTLPLWFGSNIVSPLSNVYCYIRDKLWTRHYILDVRQGSNDFDSYRWGYIDPSQKMLYACFNILKDYIENEKPHNLMDDLTLNEIHEQGLTDQYDQYVEAHALYSYWMNGRKHAREEVQRMRLEVDSAKEAKDEEEYNRLQGIWLKAYKSLDNLEEEMLERLIKIRSGLWT